MATKKAQEASGPKGWRPIDFSDTKSVCSELNLDEEAFAIHPLESDSLRKKLLGSSTGSCVLTYSAVKAVKLIRALGDLRKRPGVAKLFSKHMKIPEQLQGIRKNPRAIWVGTPNRVLKILKEEPFKITSIYIDCSLDAKSRTILHMPELKRDLTDMLGFLSAASQKASIFFFNLEK